MVCHKACNVTRELNRLINVSICHTYDSCFDSEWMR